MICTSLQTANYTSTSITHIFTRRMPPLPSNRVEAMTAHTRQILKEHSNIMTLLLPVLLPDGHLELK